MAAGVNIFPMLNVFNAVTRGVNTILTLIIPVTYVVNQFVSIRCPVTCGMRQIDGKTYKVIAVDPVANTITLDVNSSGFDAFVYVPVFQWPFTVPAGETNTLDAAYRNNSPRAGYTPIV
jgi:hypothetical protein